MARLDPAVDKRSHVRISVRGAIVVLGLFTASVISAQMAVAELRSAVAAVRDLAGAGAYSYTDATIEAGMVVKASHIAELRSALDYARSGLGLTAASYTDGPTPMSTPVKAAHIDELRNGMR